MDVQSSYNKYWASWHESERKFYKNLKPTALELEQKALRTRLDHANILKEQGNLFFKQQNYVKAGEFYLSAIEQVPESSYNNYLKEDYLKFKLTIMTNLSMCFLKNKQYNLAQIQSKEGLKQFPLNVKLRYILGCALGESEDLESSLQVLKDAKDLDPSNREIREKIETYTKKLSDYKSKMKEMFGGKLKKPETQIEKPPEIIENKEKLENAQKPEKNPENSSIIPKILIGAGLLTLGFFLGKKFISHS